LEGKCSRKIEFKAQKIGTSTSNKTLPLSITTVVYMRNFGLIGKKLSHSFSAQYFSKKFLEEGITDTVFQLFELERIEEFPSLLARLQPMGLSVTIPYKSSILPFATHQDQAVQHIGATNCLKVEGSKITAYNTDYIGFTRSIMPHLKSHHDSALILGNGGASKAVAYALEQMKIPYQIVARHAEEDQTEWTGNLAELIVQHKLLIHCTPLGTFPEVNQMPSIDVKSLTAKHLVFDLVYNPQESLLLKTAKKLGAQTLNGYNMLAFQAEASWKIWNDK
jgi:shikimate dehydrogenase